MSKMERKFALKNTLGSSSWALVDQGVVSLGNFLTQIILARSLSPSDYGIFSLLFGILLVLFTCHAGLITYPLSLKGATAERNLLGRLTFGSLVLTALLAIPFSAIVFGGSFLLKATSVSGIALLAMLFWQFQETLRRALMAHLRHSDAIWGDAISYVGQAVTLWILARSGQLTVSGAFLILAVTSAIAALVQIIQVGLTTIQFRETIEMARAYWPKGRWALLNNLSDAGSRQVFPWALALLFGPQQAGSFQAVMNVLGVSHPVLFGASNLIVPAASGANDRKGARSAFRTSAEYGLLAIGVLIPYFAGLLLFPHLALALLYGKASRYATLALAVRLAVLAYFCGICGAFLAGYLLGIGRSKYAFVANLGSAAVAFWPATILIVRFGVVGAVGGFLVWMFMRMVANTTLVRHTLQLKKSPDFAARQDNIITAIGK